MSIANPPSRSNARQTTLNRYPKGTVITHILQVKQNGRFVNPTTLVVYLRDPTGVQSGPLTPTQEGVGQYNYLQQTTLLDLDGVWTIRWLGSGVAQGSAEREYFIYSSFS
jgi:hypothetical protein